MAETTITTETPSDIDILRAQILQRIDVRGRLDPELTEEQWLSQTADELVRLLKSWRPSGKKTLVYVPLALITKARNAKWSENLELLDDTIDEIIEAVGHPHENAEVDTNALRAEHHRLMLNFPDQGYDWRTPVTALANEIPALLDEIDRLRTSRQVTNDESASTRDDDYLTVGDALRSLETFPDGEGNERLVDGQEVFDLLAHRGVLAGTKLVSTIEALDELPAGTVLKGWDGGIWEVAERDETDGYRYVSTTWSSYFESKTMISKHRMFTVLFRPSAV